MTKAKKDNTLMGKLYADFKRNRRREPVYWIMHPTMKKDLDEMQRDRLRAVDKSSDFSKVSISKLYGVKIISSPDIPEDEIQLV